MPEPGIVLGGKYRLDSEIGRGGMGAVWRATRLDLGTQLAIKVMQSDASSSQASRLDRFTREARAAASLTSPHVVRVIDFGVDAEAGVAFMAMELLEGESLASRLGSAGRQTPARVASIITQVARALTQAHAAGIVHRDLKPANIFLVRNEDEDLAKLLDFGIAKAGDGMSTATGSVLGTPYYMSPEQVGALKDVDHRTDVWSLGVIACECLTGSRPFAADTLPELAMKIALGRSELPSRLGPVPVGFDEWFARATHVDRAQRFQSASELASALAVVAAQPPMEPLTATEKLALATTLSSEAVSSLPAAPGSRREPPPTATSATMGGEAQGAGLSTTRGGAAIPSPPPREARASSSVRLWLIAAAVLSLGGVGARYALLPGTSGTPALPEASTAKTAPESAPAAAAPAAQAPAPAAAAAAPSPAALPSPSAPPSPAAPPPAAAPPAAPATPGDSAIAEPTAAAAAASPPVPERASSAAGTARPTLRTIKPKMVRQAPRASRSTARDDAPLNPYDLQ